MVTIDWDEENQPIVSVPISLLVPADSPRSDGLSEAHIQIIAATAAPLSPITVHRSTMRVIDGMHRLRAAKARHLHAIDVRFFDGTADEAFVLGVTANVYHGKPLTLAERKRAASRILDIFPNWSDRRIADSAGLSHRTVATLRPRPNGKDAQSNTRIGRDGKVHPLTNAEGRLAAADLIISKPGASLRDVAKEAGVSPGTVRDVRARLEQGLSPIPTGRGGRTAAKGQQNDPSEVRDSGRNRGSENTNQSVVSPAEALHRLRLDPAMRFNNDGRALIRSLAASISGLEGCEALASRVPDHCAESIAKVATATGQGWLAVAKAVRDSNLLDADAG